MTSKQKETLKQLEQRTLKQLRKLVKLWKLAPVLLLAVLPLWAQNPGDIVLSADFTFGPLPTTLNATCAPILSWNGVIDAYPENMGDVCAFSYNTGISIPFQLGFLNNGSLEPCNPMNWGNKTWGTREDGTPMDGTQAGDTYTQSGGTTCPYFTNEYGGTLGDHVLAGFVITADFTMVKVTPKCFRFPCPKPYLKPVLQGGKGTATETQL